MSGLFLEQLLFHRLTQYVCIPTSACCKCCTTPSVLICSCISAPLVQEAEDVSYESIRGMPTELCMYLLSTHMVSHRGG